MEKTYGGHTVAALREFLQHGDDTGETIDELTGDESSSANIIRDLLAAIHSDAAQAPIIAWVRADDPTDAVSDAKKRGMIESAGAPGKKLAECYSVPAYAAPVAPQAAGDAAQAPIYQYRMVSGEWIDFPEQDGRMHIERGHTVRIVYAAPVAHQAAEDAAQAPAVPVELLGVEDELKNGDGFWRTCSGCHETDDGHPVGDYPFSAILNCDLGSGCSECGGIGAVWDNTDYGAMADAWDAQEIAREQAEEALAPIDYDRVVQICEAHGICLPVDCVEMVVEIIRHAAPVAPAAAQTANDSRYIVIGYGESDCPQAAFAETQDELLDAVLGMIYTRPSDASDDTREEYRRDLADEDEWCAKVWRTEFEIGGIVVYDTGERVQDAPAASTPTVAADAAAPINLEGLRNKLLTPRKILRDEDGYLTHPDFPVCDEGTHAGKFLDAFGIDAKFVAMESDDPASADRYFEAGEAHCSYWTPTPPEGDGWLLLEIYDTEDGPCALFGRDRYEAENALKRQRMRAQLDRIQQRQATQGDTQP